MFEDELTAITTSVVNAKSRLSEDWPIYVGVLGMVSVVAGMAGYGIGRWLDGLITRRASLRRALAVPVQKDERAPPRRRPAPA